MKIRNLLLLILLFFLSGNILAQEKQSVNDIKNEQKKESRKKTKDDKLLGDFSYHEAIDRLEGEVNKNTDVYRKLAFSYDKVKEYDKSEQYYSLVVNLPDRQANDLYNYASVLKINKKYSEAEEWMEKYYQIDSTDSRAKLNVQKKGFYKNLQADRKQFVVTNLYMNTDQQDFGTSYYKDEIVYTSSNHDKKMFEHIWNWNKLPFLDMKVATRSQNNQFDKIQPFWDKVNKKYHDGPTSFNKSGDFMVFTRNNYEGTSKDGSIKLQLFSSERKDSLWSDPKALPYNNPEYSVGHPSLTDDGKTMYFASDMPGGIGGVDIYVCNRLDDNSWTTPLNLGKSINTEGNEMFPFVHQDSLLFFASNGLPGLGGLDVFVTKLTNERISGEPKNLGAPLNSSHDDFGLILDRKQKSGYFSSNRPEGKGDDDIYYFEVLKPISFENELSGVAKNDNGEVIPNQYVKLTDSVGIIVDSMMTDPVGKYSFIVNNPDKYTVVVPDKQSLSTDNQNINQNNKKPYDLTPADFSLYCLVIDKNTKQPIQGVKITFKNNLTGQSETLKTPVSGDFRRALKNVKLNDNISYDLSVEKEGYLSRNLSYKRVLTKPGQYNIHEELDFSLAKMEIGADIGKILNINPIYFDLDKYNIRTDAAVELDKIVKVMNDNPSMVIELGSHTDSRASDAYNLTLSDRRAKSSAEYIKQRITYPDRIYGKGYGETQLKNYCSNGIDCTEAEHQLNRRTEFKIIKY